MRAYVLECVPGHAERTPVCLMTTQLTWWILTSPPVSFLEMQEFPVHFPSSVLGKSGQTQERFFPILPFRVVSAYNDVCPGNVYAVGISWYRKFTVNSL